MNTYFIRHSESCDIGPDLRSRLWKERLIAIHYEDLRSTDPADYHGAAAKRSLKIFGEIADEGGFVCATISPFSGCLVGKVKRGSPIRIEAGPRNSQPRQKAILKTLRLSDCVEVPAHKANRLLIGQPQQGTLTQWKIIGDRVERFVRDGDLIIRELSDLLPYEQEVMCSEFLRTETATKAGLPFLVYLSAPVGRTRKALDTAGIARDAKLVFVQVTHHEKDTSAVAEKITALKEVATGVPAHLVFFCRCSASIVEDGVHFFPLQHVFSTMRSSPIWRKAMAVEAPSS